MRNHSRFAILIPLLLLAAACGTRVNEYEHCIGTTNGRITEARMSTGWNWQGPFDDAVCVPLTDQNYPEADDDAKTADAETIDNAVTSDSLVISGDVAITWQHNPTTIVETFKEKRGVAGGVTEAVLFEVRNALRDGFRSAVATQSIEDLLGPRRAAFDTVVKSAVQKKLGNRAIVKKVFIRGIGLPGAIQQARLQIIQQAAELQKARNQQGIAEAEARRKIAEAQGDAEANRLRAQSYSSNPKLLDLEIAKALANLCGKSTTCVIGASPNSLLGVK